MKYEARILVIDDDVAICRSIQSVLQKEGYAVDIAASGEEGFEKSTRGDYALLLVDLMMPGISGMELLEKVKIQTPDITVIMITGYPSIKTAVKSIKSGAFDFLPKPFTPAELLSLVSAALERRFTFEEVAAQMGLQEKQLVALRLPEGDYYCIADNAWLRVENSGPVVVGAHHKFILNLQDIVRIDLPSPGARVVQGNECAAFHSSGKGKSRLWAPLSGQVVEVNEAARQDTLLLRQSPYDSAWLLKVEPDHLDEDLLNLSPLVYR